MANRTFPEEAGRANAAAITICVFAVVEAIVIGYVLLTF